VKGLGSARAGARVGAIAGLFFSGAAVASNVVVLWALSDQLAAGISPIEESLVGLFAISFLFGVIFGVYFESIPGRSYLRKALLIGLIMLVAVLNLVLPVVTDALQETLMIAAELAFAIGYAIISARLYRRYTREVQFESVDPAKLKILVRKRDQTGKKKTFSLNATESVEVSAEGRRFKGWLVSGGVTVGDAKSESTDIRVTGDGLLKAT